MSTPLTQLFQTAFGADPAPRPAGPGRRRNPHALAQTIERMLEAARQDYWDADLKVVAELKERSAIWRAAST